MIKYNRLNWYTLLTTQTALVLSHFIAMLVFFSPDLFHDVAISYISIFEVVMRMLAFVSNGNYVGTITAV